MLQLTTKDIRLYALAQKVAMLSGCKYKHGAVIADGSRIISVACNRNCTHPRSHKFNQRATIHAEQRSLILAHRDVAGMTLYSARSGGSQNSRPCDLCMFCIREAGIKTIVFSKHNALYKERLQ